MAEGENISQGQRQLLSIARALFRTATGFSVYVDGSNICESITEDDFLQELENPTF